MSMQFVDDPAVATMLKQALADEAEMVRWAAMDVLAEKPEPLRIAVLRGLLKSAYEDVKFETLFVLEETGGDDVVPILIDALKDKDRDYRDEAETILRRMKANLNSQ